MFYKTYLNSINKLDSKVDKLEQKVNDYKMCGKYSKLKEAKIYFDAHYICTFAFTRATDYSTKFYSAPEERHYELALAVDRITTRVQDIMDTL